jgi:DNA polymerase III gamma/tau subunit
MEKFQHNTSFLATTNNPEKIDPALLTRFNVRINFGELPVEPVADKLKFILTQENIDYNDDEIDSFANKYIGRGLRDLINNLELSISDNKFFPSKVESFAGISGSETLVIQYIEYLLSYLETLSKESIKKITKDAKSDPQFFTYYDYMLRVFKQEIRLNYHLIYKELHDSDKLDFSAKNIVNRYWQDLDLKRFKHTHTIAMMHDLTQNVLEQKGN